MIGASHSSGMAATRANPIAELAAPVPRALDRTPLSVVTLIAHLGVAAVFWRSGQSKIEGFRASEFAVQLFRDEYQVPLLPPEVAANLAAFAEHLFPVMLVLGLGARLGAAGLLGMTFVIQVFVYPQSWPDHLMWASALALILAYGPGRFSIDHLIRRRYMGDMGRD